MLSSDWSEGFIFFNSRFVNVSIVTTYSIYEKNAKKKLILKIIRILYLFTLFIYRFWMESPV